MALVACLCLCLGVCLVPASPLKAQNGQSEYAKIGDWTVYSYEFSKFCRVIESHEDGSEVRVSKGGAEVGALRIKIDDNAYEEARGAVTFAFDDTVLEAQWLGTTYFMARGSEEGAIYQFRASKKMDVRIDGQVAHSYSLLGSEAAYAALSKCASQWPGSTVPLMPPPSPKNWSTSRSFKSYARPIEPETWIKPEDLRCSWHGCKDEGIVRFELKVSALGRVDGCKIVKSSGHPVLDEQTCRLLERRARFTPAKGPNGNPVESTYSSAVKWVIDHSPPAPIVKPEAGD